jgi:5'-nucleotidase/UDP-sugar diphosphatase
MVGTTTSTLVRRSGIPLLLLGLLLALAAVPARGQTGPATVTLVHDTHFHGGFGDAEPSGEACPDGADDAGFEDVPATNVHRDNIDCAVSLAIVQGTSADPPRFSPHRDVTRGELASLLARALDALGADLPEEAEQPFADADGAHGDAIARLAAVDIVQGRADGSFGTHAPVRRDQLASLLVRAVEFASGVTIDARGSDHFDDVTAETHAANVDAAFELGLVRGKDEGVFDPGAATRRDQAASVVTRLVAEVPGVDVANIARYMNVVEELVAANPGALFLGNGDDLAPSVLAGVFGGEHMIEALNASPLDVNTFGNHEFDFGPDNLRERIAESDFAWVTANVRDKATGEPFARDLGVRRFVLRDVGGVQVGITGLGPENMGQVTTLGDDTEQIPAIEAMTDVVPRMRQAGADVVVVSSHQCGDNARELAAAVDGIDVILGDHCAEVLAEPEVVNDTILSFAGDEFDLIGELTLSVMDGAVVDHAFTLHQPTWGITPDPEIQAIVDKWNAELDERLGEEIGTRTTEWDVRREQVRSTETGFANYIADAMLTAVDADVALQNGGGIRSDQVFAANEPITRRDVVDVLPFPNSLVLVEVSGETLLAALEHGVAAGTPQGRFPQVGGMAFVWDPDAEPGQRITEVTVGDQPLDPSATYKLATNDFLLGGGDGYDMLADGQVLVGPEEGQRLSDVVTERIIADGEVVAETDGRISTVS